MKAWLRFFRVVNLPTVPGDVLVGAAAVCASLTSGKDSASPLVAVCVASVFLYMFGLADNDIVGAKTDEGRPIPDGRISMRAARIARGFCLFGALIVGAAVNLPPGWWIAAFVLAVTVVIYNRTKWCLLMGLCRGLNVVCGGFSVCAPRIAPASQLASLGGYSLTSGKDSASPLLWMSVCAVVWTLYIAVVTKYSEGEEMDAAKKRRVGFFIGAIVYLQLIALIAFPVKPFLIAGAVLLIALRLMKRFLPGVSAS